MIRGAAVVIRRGKAHVPVEATIPEGVYMLIEPVYTVDLTPDDIAGALQKVVEAGHPSIATPTREEMQRRVDPLLRAAGVRSWKELARGGQSYAIKWEDQGIRLIPSKLDAKGRFVDDWSKAAVFPTSE